MTITALMIGSPAIAADIYVDGSVASSGTGGSWLSPLKHLTDALALAGAGDTVWVAEGTYAPDECDAGCTTGDRFQSFVIGNEVVLYGGFENGDGNVSDRNAVDHETILDGDLSENDVFSNPSTFTDNSCHVVRSTGSSALTIFDSFILQSGNANCPGGGLETFGSGLLLDKSEARVANCVFQLSRGVNGGGMHVEGCSPLTCSTPTQTYIANCEIRGNDTTTIAGGLCNRYSSLTAVNLLIHGNEAGNGAAITTDGDLTLINSTIADNTAVGTGEESGGIAAGAFVVTVQNCILWGNEAPAGTTEDSQIVGTPSTTFTVEHTCIEGLSSFSIPFSGNIGTNPQFFDASAGRYQLAAVSPCIDSGDDDLLPVDAADLDRDGNSTEDVPLDIRLRTRVVPGNVDMGAFEKGGPCPADIDGSDEVDAEDLLTLLAAWGSCPGPCPPSCAGDFDADCQVGTTDLLELLASWGYCDEPFAPSPPQSVVDCLDRYGSDPAKAAACIEAMILAGTP